MKRILIKNLYNLKNKAMLFFLIVYITLMIGITFTSGFKYYFSMSLVLFSFLLFYYLLVKINFFSRINSLEIKSLDSSKLNFLLFGVCIFIFILDLIYLGGPPILQSFNVKTVKEFTEIRGNIHKDSPLFMIYLSGFNIKALLPFALFHFLYLKKKNMYIILLILASFYAFSMMQKSFIVSVLLPSLIFCLVYKKYTQLIILFGVIVTVIFSLTIMLNHFVDKEELVEEINLKKQVLIQDKIIADSLNKLKNIKDPKFLKETTSLDEEIVIEQENKFSFITRIVSGLGRRVFIVPGSTVNEWFETVPSKKPFLKGDGYPFLAKLRGRTYIDYSKVLFPILKPDYAARGLKGTVNVASFVREYADFGQIGLVLGGMLIAFFMYFVDVIFNDYPVHFLALNLFPIFLISSSSVLTIFFSGGWALLILLFLVFKKQYNSIDYVRN